MLGNFMITTVECLNNTRKDLNEEISQLYFGDWYNKGSLKEADLKQIYVSQLVEARHK